MNPKVAQKKNRRLLTSTFSQTGLHPNADASRQVDVTINSMFTSLGASGDPWIGVFVTLKGTVVEPGQFMEMQEAWIFCISNGKMAARWYVYDQSASIGR